MTEPSTGPVFYSLEKLLSQTVQPFPDLPPDEFEVLRESIRARGLINPVLLTEDGYLYDGHQRCKALIALGRKRISAESTKIMKGVTRENMLGYALASNMVRRMLTSADKAQRMHACAAMGWSQRKIAKEFHMSQPGVSQLMTAYPATGDTAPVIVTQGEDGKTYTRVPRGAHPKPKPWDWNGPSYKAIHKARRVLTMGPPVGLTENEKATLTEELEMLREVAGDVIAKMESM